MMLQDEELVRILTDDCPFGDPTTQGLAMEREPAKATFTARHDMTVCGVEEAARILTLAGATARTRIRTGDAATAGTLLIDAEGSAGALHRAYKVSQTLMEILSGMATGARAIVTAAHDVNPTCRVACTRKHMPGMKRWALRAIEAGGAVPHRLGLSDYILVFEEHRNLLDLGTPLSEHFARLKAHAPERRLAAEGATFEEAIMLASAGAEIVQLDKMTPEQIAAVSEAFATMSPRPLLAAAGGINATNAGAYAAAGAQILVTSAPYYAPPRDVKVRITPD